MYNKKSNQKGCGFEDWKSPIEDICRDPNHNPPSLMVVPKGKRYRHICKSCGKISYLYPNIDYSMGTYLDKTKGILRA